MPTLLERITTATTTIETDKGKLHGVVHGPASGAESQVATDNGMVKTVARVVQENADFIAASLTTLNDAVADAAASETAAAASAAAAAAAAAAGLFSAVQDKSAHYTVLEADAGDLFRVSTGGGAVTITLPQISALSAPDGFKLAVVKWTGDGNAVTVARSGADTINGATSVQITGQYQTVAFVADAETNQWAATDMSLDSGSLRKDQNLADLNNVAAALANLGLATAALLDVAQTFTKAQRGQPKEFTDGATITLDLAEANNFYGVIGGNRTLGVPSNIVAGQSGRVNIRQDQTGGRSLAFAWVWSAANGQVQSLSTAGCTLDKLFYDVDVYATSAVTITIASPGVVTWNGHGLKTGQKIQLTTTGALPTGLTASTTYYVIRIDANSFSLATSLANAAAGTAINTSGSQSGVHTCVAAEISYNIGKAWA